MWSATCIAVLFCEGCHRNIHDIVRKALDLQSENLGVYLYCDFSKSLWQILASIRLRFFSHCMRRWRWWWGGCFFYISGLLWNWKVRECDCQIIWFSSQFLLCFILGILFLNSWIWDQVLVLSIQSHLWYFSKRKTSHPPSSLVQFSWFE